MAAISLLNSIPHYWGRDFAVMRIGLLFPLQSWGQADL